MAGSVKEKKSFPAQIAGKLLEDCNRPTAF